jgi:hypothetical protein
MDTHGIHATLKIHQPGAGVVVVELSGWDVGEFGDAPLRELDRRVQAAGRIHLFIDARRVKGASIDVSNDWALWLRKNRERLALISMLTGAPFIQLTAKFVQRFADLGEVMRIYTDAAAFDTALSKALSSETPEIGV